MPNRHYIFRCPITIVGVMMLTGLGHAAPQASPHPEAFPRHVEWASGLCELVNSGSANPCAVAPHPRAPRRPPVNAPPLLRIDPFGTRVIVLGAALNRDGSMKPVLVSRLRAALRLAREFPQAWVITTGGNPQHGRTEAQAMKTWLVDHQIAPARIATENRSRNTVENARNCARILVAGHSTGAVLVTSPDHVARATHDFRREVHGIPIAGVSTPA